MAIGKKKAAKKVAKKRAPKKSTRKSKPCAGDPHKLICDDINGWMKLTHAWAVIITHEVNLLIQDGGGPGLVPPPPPPPFE